MKRRQKGSRILFWTLLLRIAAATKRSLTTTDEKNATEATSLYETIEKDMQTATEKLLEAHKDEFTRDGYDQIKLARETLEAQADQIKRDVQGGVDRETNTLRAQTEQVVRDFNDGIKVTRNYIDCWSDSAYSTVRQSQRRFRKRLLKRVFRQRVGWDRLIHSIRDYIGLIIGGSMVFFGYTNPRLANGGAIALQASQLGWDILDAHNVLPRYEPWPYDASAILIGLLSYFRLSPTVFSALLPPVFLGVALFQSTSLVIHEWNAGAGHINAPPSLVYTVFITALAFSGFRVAQIPIPLATACISGAFLVYESARAEIVGNWVYMLEGVANVAQRSIPLMRHVLKLVGRGILWLWRRRKGIFRLVAKLTPEPSKSAWRRAISRVRSAWKTNVKVLLDRLQSYIHNHPVTRAVQYNAKRLHKALRPIAWPGFIAAWGIAFQMKYITDLGAALRLFRFTMDPVSFVVGKLKDAFDVNADAKKVLWAAALRIRSALKGTNIQKETTSRLTNA